MLFVTVYLVFSDVVEPWQTGLLQDHDPGSRKTGVPEDPGGWTLIGAGALLYWIVRDGFRGGK